ncbi:glutathione S-transferase family protein [Pararhizobium sp. BT-229]|uniref:glutathione S-transferase family protein n=1 Tax=Pararhizobium sp. BT-229 TaxID=2986923 RepID=UPI0021F7A532|nr:glutathione S-transferase family protein [Pararhizobium sp. BT-229]MCV9962394.1 glutathione S-transferase family protein [Pararhizobium sp. BT-229]
MHSKTLTLISHHLCPYVQRASIVLSEKGVAFERRYIDLSAKPDWFLRISPLGKVPLLAVPRGRSDAILFESAVICEYLEETQGGVPLHPADPLLRARHRGWMEFGSSTLADLWGYETTTDEALFEVRRQALAAKFTTLEQELDDGPYFAGSQFSMVDAVFAPVFRYFELFEALFDSGIFDGLVRVNAWRQALAVRPSVMEAVTDDYQDRLMAFLCRHDAHLLARSRLAA